MSDSFSQMTLVQNCIDRLLAGDKSARDQLLDCACERLVQISRKILRDFPHVRRWEQTDDVFQNAALRLCRSLEQVELTDARHFFRLAALQIRRELIDMARRYRGPYNAAAHHLSHAGGDDTGRGPGYEPAEATNDPQRLAEWADFHRLAEALPGDEREVFDLLWYHGLTQEEAASVLGANVRTIKRRWRAARLSLHERLDGEQPGT